METLDLVFSEYNFFMNLQHVFVMCVVYFHMYCDKTFVAVVIYVFSIYASFIAIYYLYLLLNTTLSVSF